MASSWAVTLGLRQGSLLTQPRMPLPPRRRPAYSREAAMVKAVIMLGTATSIVSTVCTIFQLLGMPGSANWW